MTAKTLVAGIGNVFLGDDGFGVAVASRLAREPFRGGVRVLDSGIRTRDLAYELLDGGYDTAILIDAVSRGDPPGTVSLIAPAALSSPGDHLRLASDGHAMRPDTMLSFLNILGGVPTRIWIVGCEPACLDEGIGLSGPVTEAVEDAVALVRELLDGRTGAHRGAAEPSLRSGEPCV